MSSWQLLFLVFACTLLAPHGAMACKSSDDVALRFLSQFNGVFESQPDKSVENANQSETYGYNQDFIFKPVEVPTQDSAPAILLVMIEGNTVLYGELLLLRLDDDCTIWMMPYNVSNANQTGDDPTDLDLSTVDLSKLTPPTECEIRFVEIETGLFHGWWPNCNKYIDESADDYTMMSTCKSISAYIRHNGEANGAPFILKYKTGSRFELPSYLLHDSHDFVSQCTD